MRNITIVLLLFCWACQSETQQKSQETEPVEAKEIVSQEIQQVLDEAGVKGSVLVYDAVSKTFYSNDFEWAEVAAIPASTFKIPNSIIALETGVVEGHHTIFPWDGEDRYLDTWEQDLNFKQAFQYSCVPCYQQVARTVGVTQMKEYVSKLNYGAMDIDSTNIDRFWLEGASKISQKEQIQFLRNFYEGELPIKAETQQTVREMLVLNENQDGTFSGKTGWAIREQGNTGWFVGYLEKEEELYFFATRIEPGEGFDMAGFANIRKAVTVEALQALDFMAP